MYSFLDIFKPLSTDERLQSLNSGKNLRSCHRCPAPEPVPGGTAWSSDCAEDTSNGVRQDHARGSSDDQKTDHSDADVVGHAAVTLRAEGVACWKAVGIPKHRENSQYVTGRPARDGSRKSGRTRHHRTARHRRLAVRDGAGSASRRAWRWPHRLGGRHDDGMTPRIPMGLGMLPPPHLLPAPPAASPPKCPL